MLNYYEILNCKTVLAYIKLNSDCIDYLPNCKRCNNEKKCNECLNKFTFFEETCISNTECLAENKRIINSFN